MRPLRSTMLAVALALTGAGCGGGASGDREPAFTVDRPATLVTADAVPAPAGPVVLTIAGRIDKRNAGETLQFDVATLERLSIVSFDADDEQAEGGVVRFSGVLLADVLALAGADDAATVLDAVALNDYRIEIPLADLDRYPVMIATSVDGERMPVERFGPLRIVYPNIDFKLDPSLYDQRWIWQLSSISVR